MRTGRISGGLLAVALSVGVQTVLALAVTPLGNPGPGRQANALAAPPYDHALTQSLQFVGLAVAILSVVVLGVVVSRMGSGPWGAALFALPVMPSAFFASVFLEERLFPEAYWYFLAPAGWYSQGAWAYGGWLFTQIALPILMTVSAALAAGAAGVAGILARRARDSRPDPL